MVIKNVNLEIVCGITSKVPDTAYPEVAFAGKSPKTEGGGWLSSEGFKGLLRKGAIVAMVLLGTLLDRAIGTDGMVFQTATACYYIANEGLSVLENVALIGVPVPEVIKRALEAMRSKGDAQE